MLAAARAAGLRTPATPSNWLATDVRAWARWLLDRAPACNDFTTHYVGFPAGRPVVLPGLESAFRRDQSEPGVPPDAQFQRELLGTGMFHQRTRGTSTSTAIYLATTLPAARLVVFSPFLLSTDDDTDSYRARVLRTLPSYIEPARANAARHCARFVDLHALFQERHRHRHPDLYCPEPVHPNATGHLVIADAVYQALCA